MSGIEECKSCGKSIDAHEYAARDGLCRECWAQHIPEDDSYWMHPGKTR